MKHDKIINILFYGLGGDGVLKASQICGLAALFEGCQVKKMQIYGISQKGEAVEVHLRIGKNIFSPLIPEGEIDFLVCLSRNRYREQKNSTRLKEINFIKYFNIAQIESDGERRKYVNVFLLGVLSSRLPWKEESWIKALISVLSKGDLKKNRDFFLRGRNINNLSLANLGNNPRQSVVWQ